MNGWTRRAATSLCGLVAVPIVVEALIAYIKDERYSLQRAAAILGCLLVVVGILALLHVSTQRFQQMLELALLAIGVVIAVTGVLIAGRPETTMDLLGAIVAVAGLLVVALAGSLLYTAGTGTALSLATRSTVGGHIDQEANGTGYRMLLRRYSTFAPDDDEVASACRDCVDPSDVHFIGYYVDGRCRFHVDVLDNAVLGRFLRGVSRESRRRIYERSGRQLSWVMSQLNVYYKKLNSGILIRTVLDVEQGALYYYYYYWISDNAYLTGVTMDQSRVLDADEKLRRLVNAIGVLPCGGPPQLHIPQVISLDPH